MSSYLHDLRGSKFAQRVRTQLKFVRTQPTLAWQLSSAELTLQPVRSPSTVAIITKAGYASLWLQASMEAEGPEKPVDDRQTAALAVIRLNAAGRRAGVNFARRCGGAPAAP